MTAWLSDLDIELLLALLWAGPFLQQHLRQLTAPHWEERQMRRRLAYLEQHGLLESSFFYHAEKKGDRPKRKGKHWAITPAGQEAVVRHDRAPYVPAPAARVLVNHDMAVSAAIAHAIAKTRSVLSAVAVFREMRIDDRQAAPIADSIVVLRTHRTRVDNVYLPWSRLPATANEAFRLYSVESDRGSEDLSVIRAKAVAYQALRADASYRARYGDYHPVVVWIAPNPTRLNAIQRTWVQAWPNGTWWRTTDADLHADRFWVYQHGRERTCSWLDDWSSYC